MDTLSANKVSSIRAQIQTVAAQLLYLTAFSPYLNRTGIREAEEPPVQ